MRMLTAAAGAALLILVATPALAGGPRGGGGGHQPRPPSSCCHGGGGGGHTPQPPHGGGGWNSNINVNVNASAQAYASAGASARGSLNARTYDVGGGRGGYGGGTVYVGGGYGGDAGGYYPAGPAVYDDRVLEAPACPSAPFGYVVTGFGRDDMRPSRCGYRYDDAGYDRGGRYGYSEQHDRYDGYAGSRYEVRESYSEHSAWEEGYLREDGRRHDERYDERHDDRRDCDCDREAAPYPPAYLPEPPRYEAPHHVSPPPARPAARPHHVAPPRRTLPRQEYRQEPGERG